MKKMSKPKNELLCMMVHVILIFAPVLGYSNITLNRLFTDHMVLQQGVNVPIWGKATDNELVTVKFDNQKISTKAQNGVWFVKLHRLKSGGPYELNVSGQNEIIVHDVMVGEVWLCSGQSNMERQLGPRPPQPLIIDWEKERDAANYPLIRQFYVPEITSNTALDDVKNGSWTICSPATVSSFSAVGYFFASHLYNNLKIPVGIIFSAVGGTPAEFWTPRSALENNPDLVSLVTDYEQSIKTYPDRLKDYHLNEAAIYQQYRTDSAAAVLAKKPLPRRPAPPADPEKQKSPGSLYNAMIAPLIPYAIKGVCWYQGEANAGRAKQYQILLPQMVNSWRSNWNQGNFPFLIVQLAPYRGCNPEIREAQFIAATKTLTNAALVATTDCGDAENIHPPRKKPVGERLAIAAEGLAYHQSGEYLGPIYSSYEIKDDKVYIKFTHVGKGLVADSDFVKGFTISGIDNKFVPAVAKPYEKDQIVVYSPNIQQPVNVRFDWTNVPDGNLYNSERLPASPFRTDVK